MPQCHGHHYPKNIYRKMSTNWVNLHQKKEKKGLHLRITSNYRFYISTCSGDFEGKNNEVIKVPMDEYSSS